MPTLAPWRDARAARLPVSGGRRDPPRTIAGARRAAAACTACPLYRRATQAVFGEGPAGARLMFVGEQPGDMEDRLGRPFVGPAGRIFEKALEEARVSRGSVYVTNAVKHFKWEAARKRRLHKRPSVSEMEACKPWLDLEIGLVGPQVVVALGATAARSLMGASFRLTRDRGRVFGVPWARAFVATVHPSSILRAPHADRAAHQAAFNRDIAAAVALGAGP